MSAPSEPENYSIDEMMERLKNRPAEEPVESGELVTRADGSQAIRVRKRKRRSHQPHKEELRAQRRARMIQVSGALILLLLAAICAGAAIVFTNSAPYRESLVKKIGAASGAKVELQQFRVNPTNAVAGGLAMEWPEGNVLRSLTFRGVIAGIAPSSFLGKSLTGEEITANEGTLIIHQPEAGKPLRQSPATNEPLAILFNRYACPKFHILFGDPTAPLVRLMNSEASFHPVNPSERSQLLLSRGEIGIQGWPKFRMDRSHIEFRGSEVDVVGIRLRHENDTTGAFELSGSVSPYATNRASTLAVQLDSFPTSGIAGPDLGRLLQGRIDTQSTVKSNYLSLTPGPDAASALAITFRRSITTPFEINGFPFLLGLARSLDDSWFEHPTFEDEVSGELRRAAGKVSFENLNLENKDRLALRGHLTMTADRGLSGNLEVGLTEAMIKASGNRRLDSMFGPAKQGFRWLALKIAGSAASPTDNFIDLLDATAATGTKAPAEEIPSFEELTRPK